MDLWAWSSAKPRAVRSRNKSPIRWSVAAAGDSADQPKMPLALRSRCVLVGPAEITFGGVGLLAVVASADRDRAGPHVAIGRVDGFSGGVPVRVRRVSSELRELRLRSGLGAEEVSTALGISMSKLSRMENGQRGLQVDDVAALLGLYRVPAKRREELLELVRNAAKPNWWQVQK